MTSEPTRLYAGEATPDLPYFDDDWFRFYYDGSRDNVVAYEVHELCSHFECHYRDEPCPWHPANCTCSIPPCWHPTFDPNATDTEVED